MENEAGEAFGEERLLALLEQDEPPPAGELVDLLAAALEKWRGSREPPDDATLVVLRLGPA